jgi:hypothetical protein
MVLLGCGRCFLLMVFMVLEVVFDNLVVDGNFATVVAPHQV